MDLINGSERSVAEQSEQGDKIKNCKNLGKARRRAGHRSSNGDGEKCLDSGRLIGFTRGLDMDIKKWLRRCLGFGPQTRTQFSLTKWGDYRRNRFKEIILVFGMLNSVTK